MERKNIHFVRREGVVGIACKDMVTIGNLERGDIVVTTCDGVIRGIEPHVTKCLNIRAGSVGLVVETTEIAAWSGPETWIGWTVERGWYTCNDRLRA